MSLPPPPPLVLVFLKAPRPGFVKTRLAAGLGAERAADVYRRLAERTLAAVPPEWMTRVCFTPGDDATRAEMRAWLGPRPKLVPQSEGDLGARLRHAFAEAAAAAPGRPLLAVGGDCPTLDTATLRAAAERLTTHPLVLGPAADGGYYLLGLREPRPELFEDIPWSTGEVLRVTLARAASAGFSVALLDVKDDIDKPADYARHRALFECG